LKFRFCLFSKILCFKNNLLYKESLVAYDVWRGKGLQNFERFTELWKVSDEVGGFMLVNHYLFTKQFLHQTFLLYCSVYLTCVVMCAIIFYVTAILYKITIKYQCIEKSRGEQHMLPLLSIINQYYNHLFSAYLYNLHRRNACKA